MSNIDDTEMVSFMDDLPGKAEEFNLFDVAIEEGARKIDYEELLQPDIPVSSKNKASLKGVAGKTAKTLERADAALKKSKAVPGLDRVMEILSHDTELTNYGELPDYDAVRNNEMYAACIAEMKSIIAKYVTGEFSLVQSREDVLRLGAYGIYLSECLGIYQGSVANARSRHERVKTLAYIKAKTAARLEGVRLSDSDAKELAKFFGIPVAEELSNVETTEKHLYNAFHSFRGFLELLNFVAAREQRAANMPLTAGPAR